MYVRICTHRRVSSRPQILLQIPIPCVLQHPLLNILSLLLPIEVIRHKHLVRVLMSRPLCHGSSSSRRCSHLRRLRRVILGLRNGLKIDFRAVDCRPDVLEPVAIVVANDELRLGGHGLGSTDLKSVAFRENRRIDAHPEIVDDLLAAAAHALEEVVENMDLAEPHARAALERAGVVVPVHGHVQLPGIAGAEIAGVVVADEVCFVVVEELVEGEGDSVGALGDVDQSVVALDPLAENDGLRGVGMVAVREREMVDPDVRARDDTDAVVFRVPVPEGSVRGVPFGEQVDGGIYLEVPTRRASSVESGAFAGTRVYIYIYIIRT